MSSITTWMVNNIVTANALNVKREAPNYRTSILYNTNSLPKAHKGIRFSQRIIFTNSHHRLASRPYLSLAGEGDREPETFLRLSRSLPVGPSLRFRPYPSLASLISVSPSLSLNLSRLGGVIDLVGLGRLPFGGGEGERLEGRPPL